MLLLAGKMMMDSHAPANLVDTAQSSYDDSKALIERWHKRGRCLYTVTPRFALTSSPEQLALAGALMREYTAMSACNRIYRRTAPRSRAPPSSIRSGRHYTDIYDHYRLAE